MEEERERNGGVRKRKNRGGRVWRDAGRKYLMRQEGSAFSFPPPGAMEKGREIICFLSLSSFLPLLHFPDIGQTRRIQIRMLWQRQWKRSFFLAYLYFVELVLYSVPGDAADRPEGVRLRTNAHLPHLKLVNVTLHQLDCCRSLI